MFRYIFNIKLKTCFLIVVVNAVLLISYYILQQFYRRNVATPIILSWTSMIGDDRIFYCNNNKCLITQNRRFINDENLKAILFYGTNFQPYDIPLPKSGVPWAIFHEESPKNWAFFLERWSHDLFDISATFSRYSDFPLTFQYLKELDAITDSKFYVDTKRKNELMEELAPVIYIHTDCDTPTDRDDFAKELMKYVNIDSYGSCINNRNLPEKFKENFLNDPYNEEFMHFFARYKFVLAIENSVCDDYITEKLWRPLIAGVVPIYYGSPSVQDWLPNNNSAISIKEHYDIKKLGELINKINKNDTLYESFLQHKLGIKKITNTRLLQEYNAGYDHPIPGFLCYICDNLEKRFSKKNVSIYNCPVDQSLVKGTSWKSHWKMGKCEVKTYKYFTEHLKLINFTKEMFDRQRMEYFTTNNCSY